MSKPVGCGRFFKTTGLEGGGLCCYSAGPAADSDFLGCCADLLLRNKLTPFSFSSSLRTVPDGRNNDTQNYPGEAPFLKSVPQSPALQPPLHSQKGLQHTSDPIPYRIKTKFLGMDGLLPFLPAPFSDPPPSRVP